MLKTTTFWETAPGSLEAVRASEMSVYYNETTRRYIQESLSY
jgi:hypothetical protein